MGISDDLRPTSLHLVAVTWGTKSDKSSISTDSTHARHIFLFGLKQKV